MTPNKALLTLVLALPLIACGSGSSDPKPDTAIPVDVAKSVDGFPHDPPIPPADVFKAADGPVDRLMGLDTVLDLPLADHPAEVAKDVSLDVPVVDVAGDRPALGEAGDASPETGDAGDAGIQLNRVFSCTKDTDCCTVVDTCSAMAYLYSRGVGASPAPSIPPNNGMCVPCIQPAIQLRCQDGTCMGEKVSTSDNKLMAAHCGYIPQADAGFHAPVDASVQPAKTSWSCGS